MGLDRLSEGLDQGRLNLLLRIKLLLRLMSLVLLRVHSVEGALVELDLWRRFVERHRSCHLWGLYLFFGLGFGLNYAFEELVDIET